MKNLILALTIAISSNALAAEPTARQLANCKIKVTKAIENGGKILDMGLGVAHLGGISILSKRTNENGEQIYTLGGGALTAKGIEGYISGSGAITSVRFSQNSCDIVSMNIKTGADFLPALDVTQ